MSATTTGEDPDPDGYQVRVGSNVQSIGGSGSVVFTDLEAGSHPVTLEGLSSNCTTANNPRSVSVAAGSEASTSFAVTCEALRTAETATQEASDSLGSALFRIINDLDDLSDLDGFTFEPARTLYQEALALDPGNQTAAFGLAITTVFALEDDPDLRAAADAWEAWLDAHDVDELNGVGALGTPGPILWGRASLPLDPTGATFGGLVTDGHVIRSLIVAEAGSAQQDFPPTLAEHQILLTGTVEPALQTALESLYEVEDPAFTFEVTPAMQGENEGEADPLELDRTEVLVLQATLEAALAGLDVATAYRAEPSPWGADGFARAMEAGSPFATLADDGAPRLADAHERLGTAVDLLRGALDFLVAESDDQDDDVIKYDPVETGGGYGDVDDYVGSEDVADARELLDEIEGALAGPTVVTVDLGQGEVDLEVDMTEFFLDPIPDLKALLPEYDASGGRFRWTAATFEEWTFPDPTLGGILPEMGSTADLDAAIELDGLYEEFAPDLDPGGAGFTMISAGSEVSCGVSNDGYSYCWGNNFGGALGHGEDSGIQLSPIRTSSAESFSKVQTGTSLTCGITTGEEMYCWGATEFWFRSVPEPLGGAPTERWMEVSVNGVHGCGVSHAGTGYCWGDNFRGRLGDGTTQSRGNATVVEGGLAFETIAAGGAHTCGITTAGVAYCWGDNSFGNLGIGSFGGTYAMPTPVAGGLTFTRISAGVWHTCGITTDRAIHCWGENTRGMLGDGTTTHRSVPIQIQDPTQTGWATVSAGISYTCGISDSGMAYCWGANPDGRLGDGTTTDRSFPTAVAEGLSFRSIDAGGALNTGNPGVSHTCGVTVDGNGYCWGGNPGGALGDGTTETRLTPVRVKTAGAATTP